MSRMEYIHSISQWQGMHGAPRLHHVTAHHCWVDCCVIAVLAMTCFDFCRLHLLYKALFMTAGNMRRCLLMRLRLFVSHTPQRLPFGPNLVCSSLK